MRASRRHESERLPLVWPGHRKINDTLQTVTTWQASFDCGLDDVGGEEGERQSHPDRTLGLALSQSERLQSLEWIGHKFTQPTMGVAKRLDENRARVGAHRSGAGLCIGDPLNDLTLAIGRWRRPWKRESPPARLCLGNLRQYGVNWISDQGWARLRAELETLSVQAEGDVVRRINKAKSIASMLAR